MAAPASSNANTDPSLVSRSPTGWRGWLRDVGQREPERLATSGAILAAGFIGAVLLLYGFAWLAYAVLEQQTQALDLATLYFLQRFASPGLTLAAQAISVLGSQVVIVVCLALLALFLFQSRGGAAVTVVLVVAGAQVLNDILKDLFHRARPVPIGGFIEAQQFSFPSGHAMVSAAFYLYVAYLTLHLVRGHWRVLLAAGLVILVLLIGLARLYLEAHYLSDVVAGYLAGLLWTDTVILGGRVLAFGRSRHLRRHSSSTSPTRSAS